MSETPRSADVPNPPEWADPRGAGAYDATVYWPPAPGAENGWRTASAPPLAGGRDAVVVRPGFDTPEGGFFWTLFEPDWMECGGWDSGRPDDWTRVRMVLCRHAGAAPGGPAGPDGAPGWRAIAVDVLAVLSLDDIAALPLSHEGDGWFPDWIGGGWEFPFQNFGRSEAVGTFERISGDERWLVCARAPSGPEVLITGDLGHGCSVTRRRLAPGDVALLRGGVHPDWIHCADGGRSILAAD